MPHHSRLGSFVVGAFCIGHLYAQGLWHSEGPSTHSTRFVVKSNATFPVERVDFVLLPSRRNFGGTCDEDGNWRIVCAPPRTDNARTRPQGRVVVRELVIPSAPEHLDYLGQDGGCRSIHSA